MKVKKITPDVYPFGLDNPKQVLHLTYLWGNDGWCYVPELKQRRRYKLEELGVIDLQIEDYVGVMPTILHEEAVLMTVYSQTKEGKMPRVWSEKTEFSCDLFLEIDSIQSNHKKTRGRQHAQ